MTASQPGQYRKVEIRRFPARALRETAEGRYWRAFQPPLTAPQAGAVTHLDVCPTAPYHFAATASTRVLVYDGTTTKVHKQFSRFKDVAYAGCFRSDGKVMAAGGESKIVQVFDVAHKTLLRQLTGHAAAVRAMQFSSDKVHVVSGSDDGTVRSWDVAVGEEVNRLVGHTDYVRAIAASPQGPEIFASGGYDHSCKIWDVRTQASVMNLDHGAPIESLAWFPSAGLIATAGGPMVCVWDVMTGRRVQRLTNHQKTVMCVRVVADVGPPSRGAADAHVTATRMFTGSLDGHLKVYDCDLFKVTHVSKYPGPITALAVAPDCSALAVGTANGLLSIRRRAKPRDAGGMGSALGAAGGSPAGSKPKVSKPPRMMTGVYRYFMRGQSSKAGASDLKIAAQRRAHLAPFDRKLKSFRLGDALDAALHTHRPEVVISLLEELLGRGGLQSAVSGRHAQTLCPILDFLAKYLTEPRYTTLLVGVVETVLDVYGSVVGQSAAVDDKLRLLKERLMIEVRLQRDLMQLQGALEPILTAALSF